MQHHNHNKDCSHNTFQPATQAVPHDHHEGHEHSLMSELLCHFPYAVFSVALGLALLSLISVVSLSQADPRLARRTAHVLFHSFHFMHIVFAAVGTIITYMRFSKRKSMVRAFFVGLLCPTVFCVLSDAVLPYIAGLVLGVNMHFHLCFYSELPNVLPFLLIGICTGLVMSRDHAAEKSLHAITSHMAHIFVSSLASTFYLVAHGFHNWYDSIGMVFLSMIVAVVIPCTLSDVAVPMIIARADKKHEKH